MKTFIEIGSCDFGTLNHFPSKGGWNGVIVDPIKKYLDNIEKSDNVRYVNSAISDDRGAKKMYVFNDDIVNSDRDFAGMSTMYPTDSNMKYMDEVMVNSITYKDLLESNNIERVDYLKIDTEGHDMNILKTVIFEGHLRPSIIKIEHKHCDLKEMSDFLVNNNYHIDVQAEDIFCISLT